MAGCDGYNPHFKNPKTTPLPQFYGDSSFLGENNLFGLPKAIKRIEAGQLYEASGLAQIPGFSGKFFSHNDGSDNRLFLLNKNGQLLGVKPVAGWVCSDWEEITPVFFKGEWLLAAADFGSNFSQGTPHQIGIIKPFDANGNFNPKVIQSYGLEYPDLDHDCEAFFFDSSSSKFYFFTKRDAPGLVYSFDISYPQPKLKPEGTIPLHYIVACSASPNGQYLLVKTLKNVVFFNKPENKSWPQVLAVQGLSQPYYKEAQGESISLNPDNSGYYTLGERCNSTKPVMLNYYPQRRILP